MQTNSMRIATVLFAAALAGAACDGSIMDDASGGGGSGGNGASGGAGGSGGNGGPNGEPLIRRLSHFEYANAVRDVLPNAVMPELEFPEDGNPHGFDNDAAALTPSAILIDRYELNAKMLAESEIAKLPAKDRCALTDGACIDKFLNAYGKRAYRRPLEDGELADLKALLMDTAGGDFGKGAGYALQVMLQAPAFLYRPEISAPGKLNAIEVASRLSFLLWASGPDTLLLDDAIAKKTWTQSDVEGHVKRMLDDPKAARAFGHFVEQWSGAGRVKLYSKDPADNFDAIRDLSFEEVSEFGAMVWNDKGSLTTLLTTRDTMVKGDLGEQYGVSGGNSAWTRATLPDNRPGIFTRVAFLAGNAHAKYGSPVKRGYRVMTQAMCMQLGAPPPGADTTPIPDKGGDGHALTNRERYEALSASSETCRACHAIINPIGYSLENYDQVGRYRTTDQQQPIDATGKLPTGEAVNGAIELANELAKSKVVEQCFSNLWLMNAFGGAPMAENEALQETIATAFADSQQSLRELLSAIATDVHYWQGKL